MNGARSIHNEKKGAGLDLHSPELGYYSKFLLSDASCFQEKWGTHGLTSRSILIDMFLPCLGSFPIMYLGM